MRILVCYIACILIFLCNADKVNHTEEDLPIAERKARFRLKWSAFKHNCYPQAKGRCFCLDDSGNARYYEKEESNVCRVSPFISSTRMP
uniref:Uncharacterized protein n=1 Tax=Romanomermis culicivorax TaxID=13658 RepID=A0A915L2H2_ROMCU